MSIVSVIPLAAPVAAHPTGLYLVISNILTQHPASMPFGSAARFVGYPTLAAAHTARARDIFPIRVRQQGSRLVVFTSDLIEYLQNGESQAALSVKPLRKVWKTKTGRPNKREQLEAKRLGLSVKELRAQSQLKLEGGAA